MLTMIRDRIRKIRESAGLSRRELEKLTGVEEYKWGNIEKGTQKVNEDHIEAITKQWPEYAFWLVTGKTIPEAGQVSPELEETRQKLGQAG